MVTDRKWFQKGAFEDGYDFGDVTKTILGSLGDLGENFVGGFLDMGESIVDTGAYAVGGVAGWFGREDIQEDMNDFIARDLYDGTELIKNSPSILEDMGFIDTEEDSIFGEKSDSLAQSAGQLAGTAALQAVGVPWWVTTGVTSFGSEVENAFNNGADYGEAGWSGLVTAGAEILTEKISGGISFGGKTLDDALTKQLATGITNKTVRTLTKLGVDMAGEGGEEVLSGVLSAIGQKLTYNKDKKFSEIFSSEDAFDSFIGGAVLGGGSSSVNTVKSKILGVDSTTGLTKNEEAVFNKVYQAELEAKAEEKGSDLTNKEKNAIYDKVMDDIQKGRISTDTIEEVLGGEDYKSYQAEVERENSVLEQEKSLKDKIDELLKTPESQFTIGQREDLTSLREQLNNLDKTTNKSELKSQLGENVFNMLKGERKGGGSILLESYNEGVRRTQAFEADLSKYDTKQAEVIKKAIDSGILNNTNRTHEFVDMVAKISADKGVLFDFANNAKLKESGFAVDGKFVNGYVTKDGITVNIDSNKALNSIVGHEITHVLEGTELYAALKVSIQEYAKSKGDYQSRLDTLTKLYEGVEGADFSAELTADLVGDYLFSDSDFISHLSTTNRNVFQKIYDEIKYLYKIATAGSKQARELEKVKRAFDKAYREGGKAQKNTAKESGAQYSLIGKTAEGIEVYETSQDTMKLTWNERKAKYLDVMKNEYSGRTAKFERNGHTYYAQFDQNSLRKPIYGDERSSPNGAKALIKAGADGDVFELVENSQYRRSRPNTKDHTDADYFDYFVKTVQIDGKVFDLVADVEKKYGVDGGYVYTLALQDNKKIKASPTHGLTPVKNVGNASNGIIPQNSEKSTGNTKFSLSDSEGKKLTKEQSEYFKDSKMRDDNGNLMVMYHGSQNAGFHIFDPAHSDDDTSLFFVNRNDVAASYSGTSETYEAQSVHTAEDVNNFIKSIGYEDYEVIEENGKFTLIYDGDRVADSDSAAGIYEEFCWYEGVGEGDVNYKVYLNLVNPLEIDGKGRPWNKIDAEFSQEVYDKYEKIFIDNNYSVGYFL